MSLPANIFKNHLIQAIAKIDNEGVPNDGASHYYDVVHNGKKYPPKLIVSYANIFANGIELARNTFEGGFGTPCFKLLEKEGFLINKKANMENIKLYDIHGSSTIENYLTLITPDNKYFYWDSKRFIRNEIGDIVFWVNRTERVVLYTKIDSKDVRPSFENGRNLINDLGYNVYAATQDSSQFETFYRFKIIDITPLPEGWNYSSLVPFNGQTMAIILYEPNVKEPEKKIEKINDLINVYINSYVITELLNEVLLLLVKNEKIIKKSVMERFKEYLLSIHKRRTTSNNYIRSMPKIEEWFIRKGIVGNDFKIWEDIHLINSINEKLSTTFKTQWKELNKEENNWFSSPWNLWVKFNSMNIPNIFDDFNNDILYAIKTKPFILLAGISGTGKSRLARTLAFQTCSKEELRVDPRKPGNFELIPVRPNWHDSSELMGYVSRIN